MWKEVTEQDLQGQPQPLILLNRILTLPNIELNSIPNLNSTKLSWQKEGGGHRRQPWKWMWSVYKIYRDQNAVCCTLVSGNVRRLQGYTTREGSCLKMVISHILPLRLPRLGFHPSPLVTLSLGYSPVSTWRRKSEIRILTGKRGS